MTQPVLRSGPMSIALLLFLSLFFCRITESTEGAFMGQAVDLVPADEDISGYKKDGEPSIMTDEESIYDAIDGEAEKYIEYNFVEGVMQEYTNGSMNVQVQVFKEAAPEDAKDMLDEFVSPGAEILIKDTKKEIYIDRSLPSSYTIYYLKMNLYVVVIAKEKSDFALNIAKQFVYNIDGKI